jgi:hypothetical protein
MVAVSLYPLVMWQHVVCVCVCVCVCLRCIPCRAVGGLQSTYRPAMNTTLLRYQPKGRGFDSRWCHLLNPSGHTVALGSTQPLTEMITSDIFFLGGGGD